MRPLILTTTIILAFTACQGAGPGPDATDPFANMPTIASVDLIPRNALFGTPERSQVRSSPDGKYLSWLAPLDGVRNLWIAPLDNLAAARAITRDTGRGIHEYQWSYLSGTLLYLQDAGGDENTHVFSVDAGTGMSRDLTPFEQTRASVAGVSSRHPAHVLIEMNDRDPAWHDLYRVDLVSGERTLVQQNDGQYSSFIADDDFQPRLAVRSDTDGGNEILKRTAAGGWEVSEQIPFEDTLSTGYFRITGDGRTAYLRDSRDRNTSGLFAVDLESGQRTLLHESALADVGATMADPATGLLQAVSTEHLREQWTVLDDSIGTDLDTLGAIGPGDFRVLSRSLDDRTWIVSYEAPDAPATYYRYDRANGAGQLTPLFSSRPVLDGTPLAQQWPHEIMSRDGLSLTSYLTLPGHVDPDGDGRPDRPVPMVLYVHGGPWVRDSYGFDPVSQWLANRGYAVLQVNYRGSSGFGKDFLNKANGEWGGRMHDDLIDAVRWAVDQGITTSTEVAIMGGSYGGYATLTGLTRTPDTFECGVDIVGPSNLLTMLDSFPAYWTAYMEDAYRRIGDPRTEHGRQLLLERSPLTHVDRISKPLLIAQGANDPRVVKAESDQIVQAMIERQIPVTYALFPDEGHGFARPENSKAFFAVAENFLAQCLGGRAEPIGRDFDGSSITVPAGADGVPGLSEALKSHTPESRG